MATRESSLWKWLHKDLSKLEGMHLCRVENSVMRGMFDVEGCYHGTQFWIELKCAERPRLASANVRLRFEPAQVPWGVRRWKCGGLAFFLVQVGVGRTASRYLVPATQGGVLAEGTTEAGIELISWIKSDFDALALARHLLEHPRSSANKTLGHRR